MSESLADCIARLGLSIRAGFVPFSKSRNAAEKRRSLNWRVTLIQRTNKGEGDILDNRFRNILTTDYSAEIGHCPAYKAPVTKAGNANSMLRAEAIERETETGRAIAFDGAGDYVRQTNAAIMPDTLDVIACLARDSDVLNYSGFEQWANDLGYGSDSRKAESIYRECMAIALQLRNGIGETNLAALQAAASEY